MYQQHGAGVLQMIHTTIYFCGNGIQDHPEGQNRITESQPVAVPERLGGIIVTPDL